jgi:hypothetical protein
MGAWAQGAILILIPKSFDQNEGPFIRMCDTERFRY